MKPIIRHGLLAALVLGCGLAAAGTIDLRKPAPHRVAGLEVDPVRYECENRTHVDVAYINARKTQSLAVVSWQDQQIVMRQVPAASGLRYVDVDEQRGFRWRAKSNGGVLAQLAPDHTATEQVLLGECQAHP